MRNTERTVLRAVEYEPLPSQRRFHLSEARFKGYSGSIGSGKSQALCQEAIRLAYVNAGRVGLIGAPTYPMLRDATFTSLSAILEENGIPYEHNKSENVLTFLDTGSRVLLRSLDEFERLRGTNLAWFGIDELSYTDEEAWLRLEGRLRDPKATKLCGFGVWTPKGFDWAYRRFIKNPVAGYEVVLAKPFENRHLLDKVPDFYSRLESSYDEKFYRQEVLGEYLSFSSGAVYSSFEREQHVAEVDVNQSLPLLWALDFNVNPMCSVVCQKRGEMLSVLDEIVIDRASTLDACLEFRTRFPVHHSGLRIYGDASGENQKTTGESDYRVIRDFLTRAGYRDARFQVPTKNPFVRERLMLMNSRFRDANGTSTIVISPKCKELIRDFEEVTYKADTTLVDKNRDPRRTHLSDALGYLVWQEFQPKAPFGEQKNRIF